MEKKVKIVVMGFIFINLLTVALFFIMKPIKKGDRIIDGIDTKTEDKKEIEKVSNINKNRKEKNIPELDEKIRNIIEFEKKFARNIFQEDIELKTPKLIISSYENPDIDGVIILKWNSIEKATAYDLEINGNLLEDVTSPYKLKNLKDGNYRISIVAKNIRGTSKWSTPIKFRVFKQKKEKKIRFKKKPTFNINLQGIMKKNGKFYAFIDDSLYMKGDEINGGKIVDIDIRSITIVKDGYNFVFSVNNN